MTPEQELAKINEELQKRSGSGQDELSAINAELARRQQADAPGILNKLANNRFTQAALNIGGGLSEGLQQAVKGIGEIPTELGLTNYRIPTAKAPFVDPNSMLYKGAKIGGEIAPTLGVGVAEAPAIFSREAIPALAKVFGATAATTPGSLGSRALAGGSAAALGALFPYATTMLGGNLPKAAADVEKSALDPLLDLSKGVPLDKVGRATDIAGSNLQRNYLAKTTFRGGQFDQSLARMRNEPAIPGPVKSYKVVNELRNLMKGELGSTTAGLKNAITNFENKPTIGEMHNLQSAVGNKVAEMRSVKGSLQDSDKIESLENIKNKLLDNIHSRLGPDDAALFEKARKGWRDDVIPYHLDPIINKAVTKGKISPSLVTKLTQEELPVAKNTLLKTALANQPKNTPIKTVLSHMNQNQLEQLLMYPLRDTIKTTGDISAEGVKNALNSLSSKGYNNIIKRAGAGEKIKNYIRNIEGASKNLEQQQKLTKALRWGTGIGAGALASYEGYPILKNYLGG